MKKLHLILALGLLSFIGSAQDLIVTKSGERIFCRILRVDSSEIVYKRPPSQIEISMPRSEVHDYRASRIEQSGGKGKIYAPKDFDPEILLLQLKVGQASPLNDFASKDVQKEEAGLAGNGLIIEATALLKPVSFIGIGLTYFRQTHRFSENTLVEAYEAYYPGTTFRCDAEDWKIAGLMADFQFMLPVRNVKGLAIDLGFRIGFPKYFSPRITLSGEYNGTVATLTEEGEPARAGTVGARMGLSYRFSSELALVAGVTYLQGKPSFSTTTRSNFGPTIYSGFDQKVTALTISMGIRLVLTQAQPR